MTKTHLTPTTEEKQAIAFDWFKSLQATICKEFEAIEKEYAKDSIAKFAMTHWERTTGGGGGQAAKMAGRVFEKVGVNVSKVYGEFSEKFKKEIPGAEENPHFVAMGISLVAHMCSPLVPAIHMNTRYIITSKEWFGGGTDLTPMIECKEDTQAFHGALEAMCNEHNPEYYPRFKEEADDYFYLPHRKEPRGIGGIFYDYLNTGSWEKDFAFTQDVGRTFLDIYAKLVRKNMFKSWTPEQREHQLIKRGRYVEFNLLYDRGTRFGLMTDGNVEAILMSLPPEVKWL